MFNYFKKSLQRKIARRITKDYPPIITDIELPKEGKIQFGFWSNPLGAHVEINQEGVDFFRKFIKEGDLVIDIGANIGDTTVPMALAAGKSGLTLGFDPNPYVYKVLVKNAALNKELTNIIPLPHAISANEEEFYYVSSEASFANGGISSTKESTHGKFVSPEKIKGVNLLQYLEKNHSDRLDRLSFIKIDTEGYDKEILKSIPDLISKYKPVIVAESFGRSTDEAKMELFEIVHQHGYTIYYFGDFDDTSEVIELTSKEEMTKWSHTINIYAVPNS
jgi:FkbM family methyltransferase